MRREGKSALFLAAMLLFVAVAAAGADEKTKAKEGNNDEGEEADAAPVFGEFVTCGSVFRLENVGSGRRLHSHDVKYGSGSAQQSVTGFAEAHDSNSLWAVHTFVGAEGGRGCVQGAYLRDGAAVKLTHLNTGRNLHSHAQHASPLSGNQEVSAYGEAGVGDAGDRWLLRLEPLDDAALRRRAEADGTARYWRRGQRVRLQHADTGLYLAVAPKSVYGNPIPGQVEVNCLRKAPSKAARDLTVWRSAEGYFFPPRKD